MHTTLSRLANGHFDLTFVLVTGLYAVIVLVAVAMVSGAFTDIATAL